MKRTRMRRMSRKRQSQMPTWRAVRQRVFARDGYGCQAHEIGLRHAIPCWGRLDPHHTQKRSHAPHLWLSEDLVIALCRRHHDWTDGLLGEQAGRLLIDALGDGRFKLSVTHDTKWERRGQVVATV